jgi:hypothetical protein
MFLHRTLLWQRSTLQKTDKIEYDKLNVPSWSWIAYKGSIEFVHEKYNDLALCEDLSLDKDAVNVTIYEFRNQDVLVGEQNGYNHGLQGSNGVKLGWINFDEETRVTQIRSMAILAKTMDKHGVEPQYFVLFVQLQENLNEYTRLGMGMVMVDCEVLSKGIGRIV